MKDKKKGKSKPIAVPIKVPKKDDMFPLAGKKKRGCK